uniref:Uncharacterized protein n=1 Tax=Steinernema glaseri TaxID=37863 RepID=A0A1I7ZN70_9BILA
MFVLSKNFSTEQLNKNIYPLINRVYIKQLLPVYTFLSYVTNENKKLSTSADVFATQQNFAQPENPMESKTESADTAKTTPSHDCIELLQHIYSNLSHETHVGLHHSVAVTKDTAVGQVVAQDQESIGQRPGGPDGE